jgi:hypothetical protein
LVPLRTSSSMGILLTQANMESSDGKAHATAADRIRGSHRDAVVRRPAYRNVRAAACVPYS